MLEVYDVIETAIESLARSGRLVRIREMGLGYMPVVRAALCGAVAALLLTYGKYYWWALNTVFTLGFRWIGNRAVPLEPPPPFDLFVFSIPVTLGLLAAGALLSVVRRWSVRHGRLLVIQVGPIAQLRAGWHVPLGFLLTAALVFAFGSPMQTFSTSLGYLVLAVTSLVLVIAWEMVHDLLIPVFLHSKERARAMIEYDLKEALAQDETAVRWQVHHIRYDAGSQSAVLTGEFPSPEAHKRVEEVALRVKGVRAVRLIEGESPSRVARPA